MSIATTTTTTTTTTTIGPKLILKSGPIKKSTKELSRLPQQPQNQINKKQLIGKTLL
jgi:hypothetical protein